MLVRKKKILIIVGMLLICCFVLVNIADYYNMKKTAKAADTFPYQIGLTGVTLIPCTVACDGGCCVGGTLCPTKDSATCTLYQEVSGTPAGGDGDKALFLKTAIAQSGLSQGGQLIAGGMSLTSMDNGVLASAGGCSGCVGRIDTIDKIKNWFNKVYMAIIE